MKKGKSMHSLELRELAKVTWLATAGTQVLRIDTASKATGIAFWSVGTMATRYRWRDELPKEVRAELPRRGRPKKLEKGVAVMEQ